MSQTTLPTQKPGRLMLPTTTTAAPIRPTPAEPAAAAHNAHADEPVTYIRPSSGWIGVDWAELVRYRELLNFLVWRDVKVKYKQAMLGLAWSVLLPMISLCVYAGVA